MSKIIDKSPDKELYFSFDRRCHDIKELQEMFSLIGYVVTVHGSDGDGFQDHFFLEPEKD